MIRNPIQIKNPFEIPTGLKISVAIVSSLLSNKKPVFTSDAIVLVIILKNQCVNFNIWCVETHGSLSLQRTSLQLYFSHVLIPVIFKLEQPCLLYTSDAADEEDRVVLGGR